MGWEKWQRAGVEIEGPEETLMATDMFTTDFGDGFMDVYTRQIPPIL